jgi:hypothetical protein
MKPTKVLLISMFITATILIVVGVVTTTLLVNDKASDIQAKYDQLLKQARLIITSSSNDLPNAKLSTNNGFRKPTRRLRKQIPICSVYRIN